MNKKLDRIFKVSEKLSIDNKTKLFVMSDCHRGDGSNHDNFVKNQNIFKAALHHYYKSGFTYIELGDGDDMWEVTNYEHILNMHLDSFKLLKKFNDSKRLFMIYGNHDILKRSPTILKKYFYNYYNKITKQKESLLDGLIVHESLVLVYNNYDIFLIHGHQVDFLNSTFWRLSRFLVRYIWRPLEGIVAKNPTKVAKNYHVPRNTEKKLKEWSDKNNKIIIAGHTHRPIFPKIGQSRYFNAGSCIHPNGISCLEIENGKITLVRWEFSINKKELLSVERKVLDEAKSIVDFYESFDS